MDHLSRPEAEGYPKIRSGRKTDSAARGMPRRTKTGKNARGPPGTRPERNSAARAEGRRAMAKDANKPQKPEGPEANPASFRMPDPEVVSRTMADVAERGHRIVTVFLNRQTLSAGREGGPGPD